MRRRDKEIKRQRDKETKRQRDKETRRQRDNETMRQRENEIRSCCLFHGVHCSHQHQFVSRHADAEFSLKELSGIKLQVLLPYAKGDVFWHWGSFLLDIWRRITLIFRVSISSLLKKILQSLANYWSLRLWHKFDSLKGFQLPSFLSSPPGPLPISDLYWLCTQHCIAFTSFRRSMRPCYPKGMSFSAWRKSSSTKSNRWTESSVKNRKPARWEMNASIRTCWQWK